MAESIENFDIMCTATLRPELLMKTFDSHIKNLFKKDIAKARLIINIDQVGSDNPAKDLDIILRYLDATGIKKIVLNTPANPSFSRAFCWCLGQLEGRLVFNLEEDWELIKTIDFRAMIREFDDLSLAHLRLSQFRSTKDEMMKVWNKFIGWNGSWYEVPTNLRGTIGWAGHPSLNKTAFMLFFRSIMDPEKNPEKQIKGAYPVILKSRFGVFHPQNTQAAIRDIGREWMVKNGYEKAGVKAHFTTWNKVS